MFKRNRSKEANQTRFALPLPHALWVAILCVWIGGSATHAALVTYTVDPTRSQHTLSGTWGGTPIISVFQFPPGTDPFAGPYSGTITADRDTGLDTLRITGGSVAALDGNYLSDFTAGFFHLPWGSVSPVGTFRNLAFSLSSGPITSPSSFDASGVVATLISGQFVENDFPIPLTGVLSLAPGSASLTDAGNIETLRIPVEVDLSFVPDGEPLLAHFSGNLVATAIVPEPASLAGLVATLGATLLRRRKRVR